MMLRIGEVKTAKKQFYVAKMPIKIWDADNKNIVISKLVETKTNSKYLIGHLDKVITLLVLILPKLSGYVKTFKVKNNKLMFFCMDDDKLLVKYKTIWIKIEDLKKILNWILYQFMMKEHNATKIRTYGDTLSPLSLSILTFVV